MFLVLPIPRYSSARAAEFPSIPGDKYDGRHRGDENGEKRERAPRPASPARSGSEKRQAVLAGELHPVSGRDRQKLGPVAARLLEQLLPVCGSLFAQASGPSLEILPALLETVGGFFQDAFKQFRRHGQMLLQEPGHVDRRSVGRHGPGGGEIDRIDRKRHESRWTPQHHRARFRPGRLHSDARRERRQLELAPGKLESTRLRIPNRRDEGDVRDGKHEVDFAEPHDEPGPFELQPPAFSKRNFSISCSSASISDRSSSIALPTAAAFWLFSLLWRRTLEMSSTSWADSLR